MIQSKQSKQNNLVRQNQTKQKAWQKRAAKKEDRPDCLKIERGDVENFWRVLNCVAQRLCWGREKVGQKGVAAAAAGREGEGEGGGEPKV